jgi:hypothetical protein
MTNCNTIPKHKSGKARIAQAPRPAIGHGTGRGLSPAPFSRMALMTKRPPAYFKIIDKVDSSPDVRRMVERAK